MSDLSATPYLHNLPLQEHNSCVGLGSTSGDTDLLPHAALFQAPTASDSALLDINPLWEYLPMQTHTPDTSSVLWAGVNPV